MERMYTTNTDEKDFLLTTTHPKCLHLPSGISGSPGNVDVFTYVHLPASPVFDGDFTSVISDKSKPVAQLEMRLTGDANVWTANYLMKC